MKNWILWLTIAAISTIVSPAFGKKTKLTAEQEAGVVKKCSSSHGIRKNRVKLSKGFKKTRVRRGARGRSTSMKVSLSKWHKDVVVIEDDGSIIQDGDMDTCAAARAYFSKFPDDRHFLFVFGQDGKSLAKGYEAYYQSYRNEVKGIGRSTYDHSSECGSNGVLLGLANMNGTKKWAPFAVPLLDLWPTGVIAHEIGHQWVSYLDKEVKGIRLSTPNNRYRSHWQPLVDTDASIMYGNNWIKLGKKFVTTSLPSGYSNLDKYLMGLIPASQVKPFIAINATSEKIKKHYALPGQSAKGESVKITMKDIQAVYGKRVPAYGQATTSFRAAAVLIVPKGAKAKRGASRIVNYLRKAIARKIKASTGGKLEVGTSLNCDKDAHCKATEFCNKGFLGIGKNQCKKKRGRKKTCLRDNHCQSNRCVVGFCGKANQCQQNSDCKSGQYCSKGIGQKKCKQKKKKGRLCTRSVQCETGRCALGRCANAHGCKSTKDCKSGQYCSKGLGKKTCKSKKSRGKACIHKAQCKSNRCAWGRCK